MFAAGFLAHSNIFPFCLTACYKIALSLILWFNTELFTNQAMEKGKDHNGERIINNSVESALSNSGKYQRLVVD